MRQDRFVITEKWHRPIVWRSDGRTHLLSGIERFDCHVISLVNEYGGGFFTVVPISPADYRRKSRTNARIEINELKHYVEFRMFDDWGSCHVLEIPRTMAKNIRLAKRAAVEQELM